jgi:hypothetical protein
MQSLCHLRRGLGDFVFVIFPTAIPLNCIYSFELFFLCLSEYSILAIPKGEVRRITNFKTFLFTAAVSCWAYVWMLIILRFSSPDIITVSGSIV